MSFDFIELEYKDDVLLPLLEFLMGVVPLECVNNLYQNFSTLKINYNLNSSFLDEDVVDIVDLQMGSYDVIENKIEINKKGLKFIWNYLYEHSNFSKLFVNEVSFVLLHELCHMASSSYDDENDIIMCGFDVYSVNDDSYFMHRGLVEGMTEYISYMGISNTKVPSQYYVEFLFVNQLCQIVGKDVLIESYFKHLGTNKIESVLSKLDCRDDAFKNAQEFFIRFEDNYQLRHQNIRQSLLANIQSSLIYYYMCKLNQDIKSNNMTYDSIMESLYNFEQSLVVPDKLLFIKKDPSNYIGLERVLNQFYDFRDSIVRDYGVIKVK